MPELPEVETTKTSLKPLLGQRVVNVQVFQPKLRWMIPSDLDKLIGYHLEQTERRAKYLILTFAKDNTPPLKLIVHLGMSGSLQQHPADSKKRKHDHLIFTFDNQNGVLNQLHYHDPRRFGAVLWFDDYAHKLFDHLGKEPLDDSFDAEHLYDLIQRTHSEKKQRPINKPIKAVIMEQQNVVGVGNIYATESLFLAGIHPATPAAAISQAKITELTAHIKTILARAIELGGSTLRDFTVASGQTGYFQQTLHVYGKEGEPCPTCGTTLANEKIAGRASVYCPVCQPFTPS
ncbi:MULTISPECIES: bifunctional DNA-formamidopyrimidine glycosylase/DNA-(apurinic or apyrimidinic site) lyase [unclassified Psychrobacter]|uniref:bifunctional DNA-formamidopyrimidine glycosylase/DNA-(apurinic or apyrimidinic site) lyase n=1 Tax=unclassified Psychrobacter TaxID=196806 RepID=UPI0018F72D07|nr:MULTISPECIES: bifunctional DNA-formamidopyrimidine glycosylase/DNA-(apurinic or apyrimidinic site) lyase [unclassified Psychrobacter]